MKLDQNETNVHITLVNQKPYIQSSLGDAQ